MTDIPNRRTSRETPGSLQFLRHRQQQQQQQRQANQRLTQLQAQTNRNRNISNTQQHLHNLPPLNNILVAPPPPTTPISTSEPPSVSSASTEFPMGGETSTNKCTRSNGYSKYDCLHSSIAHLSLDDVKTQIECTCPYGCCHNETVNEYVFRRGFLDSAYSDVTIKAFGTSYKLHRLILAKSEYFKSLFAWAERDDLNFSLKDTQNDDADDDDDDEASDKHDKDSDDDEDDEITSRAGHKSVFDMSFDDERITQLSFELALARLY
ncbi:unnamed protein product [Ambrosiozyma monospora]|uniref:Unnamed protein product n=1 Tax=Ambrosiozyma monospora TaxID=43982 RepID=A0A9W6YZS9_AMBMO|nr:unnamed protein product [Ambrosiozyma monospora]